MHAVDKKILNFHLNGKDLNTPEQFARVLFYSTA